MAIHWKLKTDYTTKVLTTQEAVDQVRVNINDDDTLIDFYVVAARKKIEAETNLALINQTWEWFSDFFPPDFSLFNRRRRQHWDEQKDTIFVPIAPFVSVTTLKHIDENGDTKTLVEGTDYKIDTSSEPGRIVPEFSKFWPNTRNEINAVTIEFVAGFGATAATIPEPLKQAVGLTVGHWYENREETGVMNLNRIPDGVERLVSLEKVQMEGISD